MGEQTSRSALVTGASRGIGLGIAELLAARGYALTIAARDEDRLASVAPSLREAGAPEVVTVPGDLADPDHPQRLAATHAEAFRELSCLVLNAGVGTAGDLIDFPVHRLDKTVAVNLRSLGRAAHRRQPRRDQRVRRVNRRRTGG